LPKTGGKRADHACLRFDIGACLAPCRSTLNGEYGSAVEQVRRVLTGHGADLDALLQARQDEMVRDLAFEQAARVQKSRETLVQGLRTVHRLQTARRTYAVLAYPGRQAGRVNLFGVAGGAIVEERLVGAASFEPGDALAFIETIHAAPPAAWPPPPGGVDEIHLVHGWLQRHREAVNVLTLTAPGCTAGAREAAARELVERVALCATPSNGG